MSAFVTRTAVVYEAYTKNKAKLAKLKADVKLLEFKQGQTPKEILKLAEAKAKVLRLQARQLLHKAELQIYRRQGQSPLVQEGSKP